MDDLLDTLQSLPWGTVGAVVAVLISALAYREARRSGNASERSAVASEESSQAAIASNGFQREVWRQQRSADVVFDLGRSGISYPSTSEMYLIDAVFRNEGNIAASDVGLGIGFAGGNYSWLDGTGDLAPGDSRTFQSHFEPELVDEGTRKELTLRLTYRDRVGRHFVRIPVVFEMGTSGHQSYADTGTVEHTVEELDLALKSEHPSRVDLIHQQIAEELRETAVPDAAKTGKHLRK